ncbi:MAG: RIP metalloprotease RseP [Candidatus Paceibacterota bacterium]
MSFILFFAVLAILVLSHEFGHFIVAKKSGIRVDEFGFGFPPRLFSFKKGETIYSINLIPFGGFVKIYGEDGSTSSPQEVNDQRSFASKSVGIRALVIIAGVIFNVILAWFLISVGYLAGMPTSVGAVPPGAEINDKKVIILEVQENSPARTAGLQPGDELVGFNSVEEAQKFILENKGKETGINYKREDKISSIKITPRVNPPAGQGAIGIAMDEIGTIKFSWYKSIWEGLKTTYFLLIAVAQSIFYFIYGAIKGTSGLDQVMGPVGIIGITSTAAKFGFAYILGFIAMLSVNLAVINILPLPALDGGRLLFLLIEKIKGSPVSSKVSNITHGIGMALLLILMLAITYRDILKLI